MPEINIQTYCGICGTGTCRDTSVEEGNHVTVTCHNCKKKIDKLEALLDEKKAKTKWQLEKIKCDNCRFFTLNCSGVGDAGSCPFDEGHYEGQKKLLTFQRINSENPRERMHYEYLLSLLEGEK